jgi:regulator of protease activity HflC (stomatin/prohibitin superfamily)
MLSVVLLVLAILVVIFIAKGLKVVPQQSVMIIERLGKYKWTLTSGLNWIIPFIDGPRKILWKQVQRWEREYTYVESQRAFIDLRENPYDIQPQHVITRDNVGVVIDGLIYFQITDASKAVYEVTDLFQAIEKLAQTSLRSLVGDMDLDHTLSGRDEINAQLTKIMDNATDKWGVKVHRVEIQDIRPPDDVQASMEKQMKAERERRATVTEAEGKKAADILTSEGEMQKKINIAEGEKQATILRAEAEKQFLVLRGEGEQTFIDRVKEGVGEKNLVEYLLGIKYIEKIPEMFEGGDKVIVPYEAMGLMGAIKSIESVLGKGDVTGKVTGGSGSE